MFLGFKRLETRQHPSGLGSEAEVWSSVWFRTQVKQPQLGRELTKSSLGWAEGSQKGILQRFPGAEMVLDNHQPDMERSTHAM